MGERVEAPRAVDLPLDLALALLKDADDRIDIGLPVSGNLEDPKFSYGHLVWKALANLVMKIAAAPFRALGALLGSENEELDTVAFAAGHSDLSPAEMEKLAHLAEALGKRPKLTLEIQGRYDSEADGAALKEWALKNELGRRTGLTLELEQDFGPINFSDPATQQALEALAVERLAPEKISEIKAASGMPATSQKADVKSVEKKSAPAITSPDPNAFYTLVYQELISREPLDENVFSDLSHQRAEAIANELMQTNEIKEDRISILDPTKAGDIRNERVTSKLKLAVSE